ADRARFVQTDAAELGGIADGSVDVITTRSVLIYVVDKPAAFAAMHRVLRPQGRISLFEPINALMYPEPHEQLWGYDIAPVVDLADRVKREYERLCGPATQPMRDFDNRDLVHWATQAGFPEVRLTLHHEVVPGALRATSFETFLDSAPNPLAPTLRETINSALDGSERRRLIDYLRDRFTTTLPTQHWAVAYLHALRGRQSTDAACPD
ncbi:MAG: methyltransferase domain-containing protein, partial [Gammaproteobacteria bacterium]|nr:methyltransferase domain-containing protein [Gammaproteobacteria bacterium]